MEKDNHLDMPNLIELNQFGGDWNKFLEATYQAFKSDFIDNIPSFRGQKLGLKKHPTFNGKEATFWHMTSEGESEQNRIPDIRRLERIKWPAYMINYSQQQNLKVWENIRGNKENVLIFYEQENYLVILRRGNGYLLPWTAYLVKDKARKQKLINEYNEYKKAKLV